MHVCTSTARTYGLLIHLVDLRSGWSIGRTLGKLEGVILLRVREFLTMEDPEFPLLLGEDLIISLCKAHLNMPSP